MKYKIIMIFIILMICSLVNAEEGIDISIVNNTLTIEGYSKNSDFGKFPAGFINPINESLDTSLDCDTFELIVVNETNSSHTFPLSLEANCIPVLSYSHEIVFDFNTSDVDKGYCYSDADLITKYSDCMGAKAGCEAGYKRLSDDSFDREGLESNLTTCNTNLQVCKSERTAAQTEKNKIVSETEDTKNQKWTYGIGGLIIGFVICLWYKGFIGGPKHKDPKEPFNATQAG